MEQLLKGFLRVRSGLKVGLKTAQKSTVEDLEQVNAIEVCQRLGVI